MKDAINEVTVMAVDGSRQTFKLSEWVMTQKLDEVLIFTKKDDTIDVTFMMRNISWLARKAT